MRKVLIVGAGVAGSTLAWWLGRAGDEVTVVDHAAGLRSSGSPVDVRGPAIAVVERMGVREQVRAAATVVTEMALVDAGGRELGRMPVQARDGMELARGDLARILAEAAAGHAMIRHGDTVTALADDGHGVDVTFETGSADRFDLVVGADGLHSRVRRLAFGPENRFTRHLGMFVATVALDTTPSDVRTVWMHNLPGQALAIHPTTGREGAALMFRGRPEPGVRPVELLEREYARMGWRAPEVLTRVRSGDVVWFDSVIRVRLPRWARGRTVLVGDAASAVTLFGEGSSLAISGAATLAEALGAASVPDALGIYEHAHRRRTAPRQRGVAAVSHLLVPATRTGIVLRDLGLRCLPARSRQ
ncbi:MAG: FAD-dependent monooxygenase [Pseudonocardia sp.]|nr:FAD-dependent monooxygenase [Pseudonocardia sp.]